MTRTRSSTDAAIIHYAASAGSSNPKRPKYSNSGAANSVVVNSGAVAAGSMSPQSILRVQLQKEAAAAVAASGGGKPQYSFYSHLWGSAGYFYQSTSEARGLR